MSMESAGCGRKLSYRVLEEALTDLNSLPTLGADVGLIAGSDNFVMSIDTSRVIGSDLGVFGQLAVVHALGDIHSAQAVGANCAVSVGLRDGTSEELRSVMEGVLVACSEEGMVVAKGHTTVGEQELTVTCAVVGTRIGSDPKAKNGCVYLTKPLGASRLLKIATAEGRGDLVARALENMKYSHRSLVAKLADEHVVGSDVSGFGLAGALLGLSRRYDFSYILSSAIPRIDLEYSKIDILCEYQRNQADFSQFVTSEIGYEALSIYGQEFCGPLVLVTTEESAERIRADSGVDLVKIGYASNKSTCSHLIRIE